MNPQEIRESIETVVRPFVDEKTLKSLTLVFHWTVPQEGVEDNPEEKPLGSIVLPQKRAVHLFDLYNSIDLLTEMTKVLNSKAASNTAQVLSQLQNRDADKVENTPEDNEEDNKEDKNV